ncbi:MAG: DUF6513 domain-containing protein [Methylococcales bacterium]|nr:DUF6513 domain-containing protein [Methylococcales bacterium]
MSEKILFLTGRLAETQLQHSLEKMQPEFDYQVHQLGLKVAALMTAEMIERRLKETFNADRILVPGRCRGDLDRLSKKLGLPVERGPNELKDLPQFFGKQAHKIDINTYKVKIFAEIVDAPNMSVEAVVERAYYYQRQGANVIDIGCLPETPFPQLEEMIQTLKTEGFKVSIDSVESDDLIRGGKAGADYMLSLTNDSVWIADEVASTPILIPAQHGDLTSLNHAISYLQTQNKDFIVDPILDPIHFGFTESIVRYHQFRQQHPEIEMMLGVGNITELTHADTGGMNAILMGICSELNINHILATEVSQHARCAIREADLARRIMFAAHKNKMLPKHIDSGLISLHEPAPFPYELDEIKAFAANVKDPSFRIQVSNQGIHIYNRDGLNTATDPFDLYPKLTLKNDGGHSFYLGVELARAQIAYQLGKRFNQDEALLWGCAVDNQEATIDLHQFKPVGSTFDAKG